jgi:hypothetical protein
MVFFLEDAQRTQGVSRFRTGIREAFAARAQLAYRAIDGICLQLPMRLFHLMTQILSSLSAMLGVMSIRDEAARWAARVEEGLSTLEARELQEWLVRSSRHRREFKAMRAVFHPRARPMELMSRTVVPGLGMSIVLVIVTAGALRLRPDLLWPITGVVVSLTLMLVAWAAWRFRD